MSTYQIASQVTLENVDTKVDTVLTALNQNANDIKRYGVRVRKSDPNPSSRVEYIFDATGFTPAYMDYSAGAFNYGSWKDIWFVKENYPVMLKQNGTIDYRLNPNDYSKKYNSTDASDYNKTSYEGNVMSRIPLTWVHFSEDGIYEYIVVSQFKYDDSYQAIAHTRPDGTVLPEIFLSCYQGSLYPDAGQGDSATGTQTLRSISGRWPCWKKNASEEIAAAQQNNTALSGTAKTNADAQNGGWFTRTWGQRQLINALLLIMSKSDDSQTSFGGGLYNSYVNDESKYYGMSRCGDGYNYVQTSNTGLDQKGQFFGYNDGTHQVKVFHMEDWWGNQWERIAGLINDHGVIKASFTGPYNTTGEGYEVATRTAPFGTSGGYIAYTECGKFGRIPLGTNTKEDGSGTNGSSSTYLCDGLWFSDCAAYPYCGGWAKDPQTGIYNFHMAVDSLALIIFIGASPSFMSSL